MDQADRVAHAVDADHLPGEDGGVIEVVFVAGADFVEDDFLGGPPAQHAADADQQFGSGQQELFALGELQRVAQGGPAAGMMLILWTGSACWLKVATRAWPTS